MKNDCIKRNYELKDKFLECDIHLDRIKVLKEFIGKSKSVVDIGCGGFMPIVLKVNNACDIDMLSSRLLRKDGWKGKFRIASVTDLPYKDKEFNFVICSEVIEHLRKKEDVTKAFSEINRISKNWIITTPSAYDKDPDHKFHFGYNNDNLFELIPKEIDYLVVWLGYYFFISNSKDLLKKVTNCKDGK